MFNALSNGWGLAKQSWRVLMLDKEMLVFPLMSGIACILVLASFALPMWSSGYLETIQQDGGRFNQPLTYVLMFAFYFVNYFVITFFNAALIACAIIRFRGGDPTLADGLKAAGARLPQILGWALVSATVGIVLQAIESRSRSVGRIVAGLLGMAWSAATYFVVPVLVVEKVGPLQAIKRSLSILRKSWGEALVANFGIGLIVFLAVLVSVIPVVVGVFLGSTLTIVIGAVITVLLVILASLASTALNAIVIGALYEYAANDAVPEHFDGGFLRQAFVSK